MDNILVEMYLPAIRRYYDIYIPLHLKLHEVEPLIQSAFSELSDGYYAPSKDMVLYDRATDQVLDINMSAMELGLCNGSRLMLI